MALTRFTALRVELISCKAVPGTDLGAALAAGVALCAQEQLPVVVEHNDREYYLDPGRLLAWAEAQRRD